MERHGRCSVSTVDCRADPLDEVLNSPRLLNLPLLLLANKQDNPTSLSVAEIRESFDAWQRARQSREAEAREAAQNKANGKGKGRAVDVETEEGGVKSGPTDKGARDERVASLDVMGASALEG